MQDKEKNSSLEKIGKGGRIVNKILQSKLKVLESGKEGKIRELGQVGQKIKVSVA